jgi:uncharacterized protein (DUF2336 family)
MSPDHRRPAAGEPTPAIEARFCLMGDESCLIDELEAALAGIELGQRAEVLRRITDLFSAGSAGFSSQKIALFDDIMCRLVAEIETSARAQFGQQIAAIDQAPPKVVRTLVMDDSIDVAGPVLSGCAHIDETALVESALAKSQDHLLVISRRRSLGEAVTDVLVERGDRQVAISTAANLGAKFSEFGYSTLVKRSEDDGDLAMRVWSRPEIPRAHLLRLLEECSESVRRKIRTGSRHDAALVRELVAEAADRLQAEARDDCPKHASARECVQALYDAGELDEARLAEFARAEKFDETAVALAVICNLPIGAVERAMAHHGSEQIVVLAKAAHLSWSTTEAILAMRSGKKPLPREIEQGFTSFTKLRPETAEQAMRFYRLREQAAKQAD